MQASLMPAGYRDWDKERVKSFLDEGLGYGYPQFHDDGTRISDILPNSWLFPIRTYLEGVSSNYYRSDNGHPRPDKRRRHPLQVYFYLLAIMKGESMEEAGKDAGLTYYRRRNDGIDGLEQILQNAFDIPTPEPGNPVSGWWSQYYQPFRYSRRIFEPYNPKILSESLEASLENGSLARFGASISPTIMMHYMAAENKDSVISALRSAHSSNLEINGASPFFTLASQFHAILPLLPEKSRKLQLAWAEQTYKDFFGGDYFPGIVHLPEMAYDQGTLATLAEEGIKWVMLSPNSIADDSIDVSRPYKLVFGDNEIGIIFYDKFHSDALSFGDYQTYPQRLGASKFDGVEHRFVAMDGETWGHHGKPTQYLRDLLDHHIPNTGFQTVPPPIYLSSIDLTDVEQIPFEFLYASGSWSCGDDSDIENLCRDIDILEPDEPGYRQYIEKLGASSIRGLMRWFYVCDDCNNGDWNLTKWKIPFKGGLTQALEDLHEIYDEATRDLLVDPYNALVDYIRIRNKALDRTLGRDEVYEFAETHFKKVTSRDIENAITLMEGLFFAEAAQTSCGTFWNTYERLEPTYNIIHIANAVRLFRQGTAHDHSLYEKVEMSAMSMRTALELAGKDRAESVGYGRLGAGETIYHRLFDRTALFDDILAYENGLVWTSILSDRDTERGKVFAGSVYRFDPDEHFMHQRIIAQYIR